MAKVITGVTGSKTGGVSLRNPAISATSVPPAGSNLEGARGVAVEFATTDIIVPYKAFALYNAVTLPEIHASQGIEPDVTALATIQLMASAFNTEERLLLMGRDSTLSAPTIDSAATAARAPVSGVEQGITGTGTGGTNVFIKVTAVGAFGESAPSAAVSVNIPQGQTRVIDVVIQDVTGALGYRVYASLADGGGADPGDGSRYLYGQTGFNKFTLGVSGRVSSGPTVPTADTGTGSADNYKGLIQFVSENGGYVKRVNAKPTGAAITMLQDALASMWESVKANPDEVLVSARERRAFSDLILSAAAQVYRITLAPDQQEGVVSGVAVSSVINESTGASLKVTAHPWLEPGNAVIVSYTIPFPVQFGVSSTMEVKGPADWMVVEWPLTTLRREFTLWWMNSLVCYAPAFFGVLHGIAKEDDPARGALQ